MTNIYRHLVSKKRIVEICSFLTDVLLLFSSVSNTLFMIMFVVYINL